MAKLLLLAVAGGLIAQYAKPETSFRADWSRAYTYVSTLDKRQGAGVADYACRVREGVLELQVRSVTNAEVKTAVGLPAAVVPYAGRYMTLRATVSGTGVDSCGGLLQGYIDRTDEGKGRKHYWKPSELPLTEEATVWTKTRLLDPRLTDLSFSFVAREPGVYRFHELAFCEAPDPLSAYEPGRNYLANGGAEQGLYATSAVGEQAVRFGTKGGVIEPTKGRFLAGMLKPAVSAQVAHSGRRSFELGLAAGHGGRFYFNPVPTVDGRAFVFSFWVRASERRWFKAGLFVASGAAYEQSFPATAEWTRIVLRVPKWGEAGADGLKFFGKVMGEGLAVPYLEPSASATYWIDDAYASVGVLAPRDSAPPPAALSAVCTSAPRGVCRPGEPAAFRIRVAGLTPVARTYALERRIYDWRNRPVDAAAPAPARTLRVGPDEEVELNETVPLPTRLRGPVTVVWTLKDGAKAVSAATAYFGVQPKCRRVEPRLSVNVLFGSPEQSLAVMREFGIGGARLWGPCRNWDMDFGYAYTKLFHDAGIRTLFVLGVPQQVHDGRILRSETLLPADTAEWFARQTALLDAHRGEVDVYEFLNEYNIWPGRLKSPDPTRFAEPTLERYVAAVAAFRPLLRRHDPDALLAGCATCSTDLAFIGRFLEQGGGRHVDMITEHAYSGNPDCPDYAKKLTSGLAMARAAGVAKWAQTEAGATSPNHLTPGLIHPRALDQVSNDLRNMLIAWARGLDHFSHFMLATGRAGTDWNLTYLGNAENGFEDLPKPALFAFRTAADLLASAPCTAEAQLAGGCKGYVFDRCSRRVAAVWKWNGGTATLKPSAALDGAVWLDAMGNRLPPDAIELSGYPVYCVSALAADELVRALEASPRTAAAGADEAADASDPNLLLVPSHGAASP